jgi:hypothetical protein
MFLIYDGTQNTQQLTFTHDGLTSGTEYNYQLVVLNYNGASNPSNYATRFACEVPTNFRSLQVQHTSSTGTVLSWKQPLDIGGCPVLSYTVMVDDGAAGAFTQYGLPLSASSFTTTVSGLTYTLQYRF